MNKKLIALTGILILLLLPAISLADADLDNTNPGDKMNVAGVDDTDLPNFQFQVSENVRVIGTSAADSFSIATWHQSALTANGGVAYAGATDLGGTYVKDISDPAATVTLGGTTGDSSDVKTADDFELQ